MICCGEKSAVVDSRRIFQGTVVSRWRYCKKCGREFRTYEKEYPKDLNRVLAHNLTLMATEATKLLGPRPIRLNEKGEIV